MELPFGGTFAKDTFETGTRAAAFGGTTTIVDFAVQSRGKSLREGLDAWHAKAEGNAVADYGFHMIMSDVNDDTLREMDELVAEGVPDFKLFTAYPGVFYSDDGAIFRAMQQTTKNGGLIMMHAENGMAIDVVAADEVAAGTTDPYYHGVARYPIFEGEATNRVIRLAEAAGVPVYIVHLSARDALNEVREARDRGRDGLRRDLPAVPVPVARRHGQRVRGREVRLLAAAAPEGPPGRAVDAASSRTTCRSSRPTTARSTSRARRSSAGATSARCPTACPASRTGSTCSMTGASWGAGSRASAGSRSSRRRRRKLFGLYPRKGAVAVGLGRGPRRLRPERASGRSRPRPTTWTSTTRATRAARSRAHRTSCCRAARSSSGTASSPGRKGHGRFLKRDLADFAEWPERSARGSLVVDGATRSVRRRASIRAGPRRRLRGTAEEAARPRPGRRRGRDKRHRARLRGAARTDRDRGGDWPKGQYHDPCPGQRAVVRPRHGRAAGHGGLAAGPTPGSGGMGVHLARVLD